jgi:hypothetical protein
VNDKRADDFVIRETASAASVSLKLRKIGLFCTLIFALIGILTYSNYHFLVQTLSYPDSDFMTLWAGGRALVERIDPYDPKVWIPLFEKYGATWIPNPRAPYPLWTSLLFVPLAWLKVEFAAAVWQTISEILLGICILILATQFNRPKITPGWFILLILGGFAFRGSAVTILNGQVSILLLFIVTLFVYLLQRGRSSLAGITLAFVLCKPSPFILFVPLIGLWLLVQRRWKVMAGCAAGAATIILGSLILQPGWFFYWLAVRNKTFITYRTPTVWGLAFEISPTRWMLIGIGIAFLVTAYLGWLVVRKRVFGISETVSLALAGSLFITPYAWPYEHTLLMIPIILLISNVAERQLRIIAWFSLTILLPWSLFIVALNRGIDTFSFLVPLLIGTGILFQATHGTKLIFSACR